MHGDAALTRDPSLIEKKRYLVFSAGSNQTKETTTNEGKKRKA